MKIILIRDHDAVLTHLTGKFGSPFVRLPVSTISPSLDLFSDLYSSHHGWLYNWLWRKLGCRDGAADLAQDTFVRMLATQSADSLREPRAYLSTVANGLLVNHWRRLTLERTFLAALANRPELTAPSPEERALVVESLYRIDAMLDTLSPRARQAFLLAQLDGLTYAQIAVQLDVSERMVKKYMAQAMLQCMLCLDDAA
ncbi:sigma-70 family RNA polymerase sigma factor [Janthinobacterium sp. GMG1]|uniref:sigma-70 family RNA polymerase sigma factor n=1 Tax=Janthinobacterium sp. GMG1 TaxID=3096007 RepID=UPI002ACA6960|nr:sigma-70 family RNA polymerase sigma factor [Janthinobacterium sp. GMG1]MDZ5636432.1 sigma-70 family RNA polymerase sigma factor [Janthinobacterium sp. GMG1]